MDLAYAHMQATLAIAASLPYKRCRVIQVRMIVVPVAERVCVQGANRDVG